VSVHYEPTSTRHNKGVLGNDFYTSDADEYLKKVE
jgi:hypothetical protein